MQDNTAEWVGYTLRVLHNERYIDRMLGVLQSAFVLQQAGEQFRREYMERRMGRHSQHRFNGTHSHLNDLASVPEVISPAEARARALKEAIGPRLRQSSTNPSPTTLPVYTKVHLHEDYHQSN